MRVIAGKGHLGLEVTAVVERVWIEHDEGNAPLEDVIVQELWNGQLMFTS
jgi:hypothetical protein